MNENATEKKLTTPQRRAIEALATTGKVTEAAAAAQVNRGTLYRWQRQPHFKQALQEAEQDALATLSTALVNLTGQAIEALADGLGTTQKMPNRLRAAQIVIANLAPIRQLATLEALVSELEGNEDDE